MDRYIVMTASACMPARCWGAYRRVAVIELTAEYAEAERLPRMISTRAIGVKRIVETWEKLNVGKTDRCAYRRALAEAETLCLSLNRSQ